MYQRIALRSGCIGQSHSMPPVSPEMSIKLWCLIQPIIISVQITSPDKILRVSCDVYFVAVPFSFREASHSPHLLLMLFFELRCYWLTHTSIYQICIWSVIYACAPFSISHICRSSAIYADEFYNIKKYAYEQWFLRLRLKFC